MRTARTSPDEFCRQEADTTTTRFLSAAIFQISVGQFPTDRFGLSEEAAEGEEAGILDEVRQATPRLQTGIISQPGTCKAPPSETWIYERAGALAVWHETLGDLGLGSRIPLWLFLLSFFRKHKIAVTKLEASNCSYCNVMLAFRRASN